MNLLKTICLSTFCIALSTGAFAQNKTAYFNNQLHIANRINPSLLPEQGYINLPVMGYTQLGFATDFKNLNDLVNAFSTDESILNDDSFYDKLKIDNRMNFDINTDVFSAGWWKGNNFWSVNVGLKVLFASSLPKSLFEHIREVNLFYNNYDSNFNIENIDIQNMTMDMKAYSDIGVGFARRINEKVSVGARAKLLLGFAHLDFTMDELRVNMNLPDNPDDPECWKNGNYGGSSYSQAHIKTAFAGGGLSFDQNGILDEFDVNGFGIAGVGMGMDLGATYSPIERLNLSFSLLDLGFLKWKESAISMASVDNSEQVEINADNYWRYMDDDLFGLGMFEMHETEAETYSTNIGTTLMVGAEYKLGAKEQFSVGGLYSGRFTGTRMGTLSSFSVVGGYMPFASKFNASLSYSFEQKTGNVLGALLKFGTGFMGADYAFSSSLKSFGFYFGASIPLGKPARR